VYDAQFVSMIYLEPCKNVASSGENWLLIGPSSFSEAYDTINQRYYSVKITMKNTGTGPWAAGSFYLGSANPTNNTFWGISRVPVPVPQGQTYTFEFSVRKIGGSPPNSYNFQWQMVGPSSIDYFGEKTANV